MKPVYYYCKLPDKIAESKVILVDPMLATGGSAIYSLDYPKKCGVEDIVFLCLIAAPEGIKNIREKHPDVDIFVAKIDNGLNEKGYIYPGLGDAGDRIFGTKELGWNLLLSISILRNKIQEFFIVLILQILKVVIIKQQVLIDLEKRPCKKLKIYLSLNSNFIDHPIG